MSLPRLCLLLLPLYLAQGLPGGFLAHALPVILREQGASLELIALLKLLALPWVLKFIWAPYIDKPSADSAYQQRRRWVLRLQPMLAVLLLALGWALALPSSVSFWLLVVLVLAINTLAATQDIATDGLAVSQSPSQLLGAANSMQVAGYKLGMIAGGSGLLLLSGVGDWPQLFAALALTLMLLLLPLWRMVNAPSAESANQAQAEPDHLATRVSFAGAFKGFVQRPGIIAWLFVLLTYKLADALGSGMLKPMLVDLAWSSQAIGTLTLKASLVGMLGALMGGFYYRVVGQSFALLSALLLQIAAISSFYFIAEAQISSAATHLLVAAEQFVDGLSTVVLFALMMSHCRKAYAGSDYTLQASIQIVLAGVLGALSGALASALSYQGLYLVCALSGILSVTAVLVYLHNNKAHIHPVYD